MTDTRELLLAALRAQRHHVISALGGLPEAALTTSVVPSGWTPLGMVRHLTLDVERFWFRGVVAGRTLPLPSDDEVWHPTPWPDRRRVVSEYVAAAADSDRIIGSMSLDALPPEAARSMYPWAPVRSLLGTVLHVITETATHAGHLDIGRELIDGHQDLVLTEFSDPSDG